MGSYLIRLRVYPENPGIKREEILSSISSNLPDGATIKDARTEPIAFGLEAFLVDVVAPEQEGWIEKVENAVSNSASVSQYELIGVSRLSSNIPGRKE